VEQGAATSSGHRGSPVPTTTTAPTGNSPWWFDDRAQHARLDHEAKLVPDREVEPAVHNPEAVRTTQHRASGVREIVVVHGDVIAVSKDLAPHAGIIDTLDVVETKHACTRFRALGVRTLLFPRQGEGSICSTRNRQHQRR
jgi:hypothetical protein